MYVSTGHIQHTRSIMRPYKVDVPVRVLIWTRPDLIKRQFEVIKEAAPSILFLVSDGGRNDEEKALIEESRKVFEGIDWQCTVYKMYLDENKGVYGIVEYSKEFVWGKVDRCILLEDDQIPAVSFFSFCSELLEKYKDDERIEQICGNNALEVYEDALPNDYFFTENGWSIWGTATWRRRMEDRVYPLPYRNDEYIKQCMKDNLSKFWYKKFIGYYEHDIIDNHEPGDEYYHAINSALYHRLSIIPTRNMISNVGIKGEHADTTKIDKDSVFCLKTFELEGEIKHPKYVIDDKKFGKLYEIKIDHVFTWKYFMKRFKKFNYLLFTGKLVDNLKKKINRKKEMER